MRPRFLERVRPGSLSASSRLSLYIPLHGAFTLLSPLSPRSIPPLAELARLEQNSKPRCCVGFNPSAIQGIESIAIAIAIAMSVACDRSLVDPYANGVRQGKRKEVDREEEEEGKSTRPGFYIAADDEEEIGSDGSSSIGVESNCSSSLTSSHGEEEEVSSKQSVKGGLGSFDSLEESLPIKRGLSNFFSGKSKSFTTLSSVANSSAADLSKPENPFNKRRRVLLACNRRASYSSFVTSLPSLLSPEQVVEERDDEEGSDDSDEDKEAKPALVNLSHNGMIKGRNGLNRSLISPRSFSLSDLRHA